MKYLFTVVMVLLLSAVLLGQGITNASFNGTVKDNNGMPLVGANVVAVHEPSGSVFGASTRDDGRFNLVNVRVGGPYTITVSYIGYTEQKIEDVIIKLGEDRRLNFTLVEEAIKGAEITVVAERSEILSASNMGTATSVSLEQIERLPTINRSINDYTRLTPQAASAAGGTSIAGSNNRYNNFQVDGAVLTDPFGLQPNRTPTDQINSQPISLDAIQEFQVEVSPFDVRSGGFVGGLINAVTRSGDNQFSGSAYYFGRNESFVGKLEDREYADFTNFQTGARISGPIMQNKLFFFVNAEWENDKRPSSIGPSDSNQPVKIAFSSADFDRAISISQNTWGYDPGGYSPITNETKNLKLFGRLDWNISNQHRLTLRSNYIDGDLDDGLVRTTAAYPLENTLFLRNNTTTSTVMELNSAFGNNKANQARLAFTTVRDKRTPEGELFPQVEIFSSTRNERIRLGTERFSQKNALDQDVIAFTDNFLIYSGDHTFTLGTHNEYTKYRNLFIQDAYGAYEFDSLAAYQAGRPSRYFYSYSQIEGTPYPEADWGYYQLGFYGQDAWKIAPAFNFTYGVRVDIPLMPDEPLYNPTFANAFPGRSTSEVPSGNLIWSPRFGFNWDVLGDRSTQLRGGFGMFSGFPPGVWISNQYSNTGVELYRLDLRGAAAPNFSPDPFNQPLGQAIRTSEVNLTDTDFKMPQVMRTSIALDRQLPRGFVGTLEFVHGNNVNEIRFRNINLGTDGYGSAVGEVPHGADGRPAYATFRDTDGDGTIESNLTSGASAEFVRVRKSADFTNVILMENTSEGHQWNFTARVQKQLNQGIFPNMFGSLSYTISDAQDINSNRSSRAISNWQFNETDDPNGETVGRSDFLVRHRFLGNLSYQFRYAGGWATTVSLFYESRSGAPFSYLYGDDANGDGVSGNDLAFIPTRQSDVVVSASDWAKIEAFINSDEALQNARGQIFPRNSATAPWQNYLDLRIAQKLPTYLFGNLEVTLDILNLPNLLNSDWGKIKFVNNDAFNIYRLDGYDAASGRPKIRFTQGDTNKDGKIDRNDIFQTSDLASRWQMQIGLRYSF